MRIEQFTLRDYWQIAVRRKWLILWCALAGTGLAFGLLQVLPKTYRSSTLILVENQRVPEAYVSSPVGGTVADRLSMISQYVMSRTVLMQVIDMFKLDGGSGTDQEKENLLIDLRKNIKVETKAGGIGRVEAFSISFAHRDPKIAQDVTAKLASQFIEENLRAREALVESTTEFLESELARAKDSLEKQEAAIAAFKRRYMGELPGQTDANLSTLSRLQKDLAAVEQALQSRTDRRLAIQRMMNSYEMMRPALAEIPQEAFSDLDLTLSSERHEGGGQSAGTGVPVARIRTRATDTVSLRIKELERTLATLTAEYKDTYPDIIKAKQELAQLKAVQRKGADAAELEEEKGQPQPASNRAKKVNSLGPVDPYIHELKKELDENDIGIQGLKEQLAKLKAQTREYELRVERAPEREQELIVLQRDYENTKKNYQSLLDKQLNARISESLEKRKKGETFRVLDPANFPTSPDSPDAKRILVLGLVSGGGLGYGWAFLLEVLAGVIRRSEDAESLLGLPVLATIPNFRVAFGRNPAQFLPLPSRNEVGGEPNRPVRLPASGQTPPHGKQKRARISWFFGKAGNGKYSRYDQSVSESVRQELNLVAKWQPTSLVAEQYRVAATRIVLSCSSQKSAVIALTSAVKGEGKSTTVSNLGYVLAQDLGKSTVVIDCDFKCPMLHAYTSIPAKPGLAEAIYGDLPIEACLHKAGDSSLWVLPSGRRDHRLVDLTKIPQINTIVGELRQRFEFILIDAPPILPLADMNLLASIADMLIFVIRAGSTPQDLVQSAVKGLKPANRAGVILTGSREDSISTYFESYYQGGKGVYRS
jgi:polysaccharide chain length determinant protein (PEP-CTERM system associated)